MSRLMEQAAVHACGDASGDAETKASARRRARVRGGLSTAMLAVLAIVLATAPASAYTKPDWDQVANIKEAARRLADMQRSQGATGAFKFIDACYRTHSLSAEYTRAFEACIAQDYLETRILALIYSRMPPETLKRLGMPTPQMLADTMGKRIVTAFRSYDVPVEEVKAFKKLVDEQGFPVFFKALFPNSKVPEIKDDEPNSDASKSDGTVKPDDGTGNDAPKNGKNE